MRKNIILILSICLFLAGCSEATHDDRDEESPVTQVEVNFIDDTTLAYEENYAIYTLEDGRYLYEIRNNDDVIVYREILYGCPIINIYDNDYLEILWGAGTGVWFCKYYNLENNFMTDALMGVHYVKDGIVAAVAEDNGDRFLRLWNPFSYSEYVRDVAIDFAPESKILIADTCLCDILEVRDDQVQILYFNEQGEQVTAWVDLEASEYISEEMDLTEDDDMEEYIPTVSEPYAYNVEKKMFSFYTNETVYSIPYAKIEGCPDSVLEWKINHTLWEEASWIFDCAELEDHLYSLFKGEMAIHISDIYQYDHYLSIVYECGFMPELPGNIVYAIVVDVYTGERVLLADLVQDENQCLELLLHYFDDVEAETYVPVLKAEEILFYGGMTEDETVNYNISLDGHYPERINGRIGSISYLFESASFYVTGEGLVVLPGARGYTPMRFEWKSVEGAFEME